jgi:hypothetical protein
MARVYDVFDDYYPHPMPLYEEEELPEPETLESAGSAESGAHAIVLAPPASMGPGCGHGSGLRVTFEVCRAGRGSICGQRDGVARARARARAPLARPGGQPPPLAAAPARSHQPAPPAARRLGRLTPQTTPGPKRTRPHTHTSLSPPPLPPQPPERALHGCPLQQKGHQAAAPQRPHGRVRPGADVRNREWQ